VTRTRKTAAWQAVSGIGSAYLFSAPDLGGKAARLRVCVDFRAPKLLPVQGTSGSLAMIMEPMVVDTPNFQNQATKRHAGVTGPFPWRPPV